MKKILLIGKSNRTYDLRSLLSGDYDITIAESVEEIDTAFQDVSAVIIDSELALKNDFSFLKQERKKGTLVFTPLIVITDNPQTDEELKCLSYDVVDFLPTPFRKLTVINRIENAIRIKDSASFYEIERMLKALPSNIYLKDAEGRYIFATHYWHHIDHSSDPDWTIRGKTDVDIRKDKENAQIAMEKDLDIIRTGKGTSYLIEINTDGKQEFFNVFKEPVRDRDGNISGIVGLINNVTEHETIKRQWQSAAIMDGMTGLFNRREIQLQIERAITDSRQNNTVFSVVMLDIDNFKQVNDCYGHKTGDNVIIALADILKNNMGDKFSAGRWGGEEFMILLRDTEISPAFYIAESIRKSFENIEFPDIRPQTVSVGVTQLKESDTSDTLCMRVDDGLYKAKKRGKNCVVVVY